MKAFTVRVEKDHISKLTHVTPLNAISELIWNSLDAEATEIELSFTTADIGVTKVHLSDNGHGISYNDAEALFGTLGGSWKRQKKQTDNRHRLLHGREGQGRFRSFAVGSLVTWTSVYNENGQKWRFTIIGTLEEINRFHISDPEKVTDDVQCGVSVTMENITKHSAIFDKKTAIERLTPLFALYLNSYQSTKIKVEGTPLNPDDVIIRHGNRKLKEISFEGEQFPASLEIVEWSSESSQDIYFCTEGGFPLCSCEQHSFKLSGNRSFTVYIKSEFIERMNSRGLLQIAGMIPELNAVVQETEKKLKSYFKSKAKNETEKEVLKWQDEKTYPYEGEPTLLWEKSERRIFDTVAHQMVKHLPEFEKATPKLRSFQFNLIKEMIDKSPEAIYPIFKDMFKMKEEDQKTLDQQVKRFIRQRERNQ